MLILLVLLVADATGCWLLAGAAAAAPAAAAAQYGLECGLPRRCATDHLATTIRTIRAGMRVTPKLLLPVNPKHILPPPAVVAAAPVLLLSPLAAVTVVLSPPAVVAALLLSPRRRR